MSQHPFEKCKELVGHVIKTIAEESMTSALDEEILFSADAGDGTYHTTEHRTLAAVSMSNDTGWNT